MPKKQKQSLAKIVAKILDMPFAEELDENDLTNREALVARMIKDAIADDDPAVRLKAGAMLLDLISAKDEIQPRACGEKILNKSGKQI